MSHIDATLRRLGYIPSAVIGGIVIYVKLDPPWPARFVFVFEGVVYVPATDGSALSEEEMLGMFRAKMEVA